jgi:hypothetical protein
MKTNFLLSETKMQSLMLVGYSFFAILQFFVFLIYISKYVNVNVNH